MTEADIHAHIQAAEECLENAGNQAAQFKGIAAAMAAADMADVASLLTAVISLTGVQASLAEATAHATLAIAKQPVQAETASEQPSAPDFLAAMNTVQAQLSDVRRERDEARSARHRYRELVDEVAALFGVPETGDLLAEVRRLRAAQSDPLVLRPPVVPAGTVALIGERTGRRYTLDGGWWRWDDGDTSCLSDLTALLADEGSLRVELAQPTHRDFKVLAGIANDAPAPATVHRVPPDGRGVMSCCGRTPFEVPWYDSFAAPGMFVTCRGTEHPEETK